MYSIIFLGLGLFSVVAFYVKGYFPIFLSILIFLGVSAYLFRQYKRKKIGLLMLLYWLVYVLPFIHIPPYLWFDFNSEPLLLWGLAVNPYMLDEAIIKLTAMIGAVGGLGFALGVSLSNNKTRQDYGLNEDGTPRIFKTMSFPLWIVWVFVGVMLTYLSAPKETVFMAAYTESKSVLDEAKFSFASAWMISYVILSFAFCDALLETAIAIKKLKTKILMACLLIVVVWFQLLRGDRESLPWVLGLLLVYYYWAAGITQQRDFVIPWYKIAVAGFMVLVVSMLVGAVRSGLAGVSIIEALHILVVMYQSDAISITNILYGTWSAVLLTPLSVAGDHINGLLNMKLGSDYLDFLLSIIPGFLADFVGYVRPIDSFKGPAWEMRYGLGGTHATVVPFMNFGMVGVFFIIALWSWILTVFEKSTLRHISVVRLSALATLAMVAPHWLWYGEKAGINAFVIWWILSVGYRLSLRRASSVKNRAVDTVKYA